MLIAWDVAVGPQRIAAISFTDFLEQFRRNLSSGDMYFDKDDGFILDEGQPGRNAD
ncbi:MAG: hypothetical protein AAFV53_41910 [Myxococcota bacterium]